MQIKAELEQLKQIQQEKTNVQPPAENVTVEEAVYSNYEAIQSAGGNAITSSSTENNNTNVQQEEEEEEIIDTGLRAVALYDYQAAAEDEISFDPDDPITHIEMVTIIFLF